VSEASALRGATWMAGAFAASRAMEIVPAGALFLAAWAGSASASTLVTMTAALALATAIARIGIFAHALRGLARGAPRVPWVAVIVLAVLALVAYPVSTASYHGITMLLAQQGAEALAEHAMGNMYVSLAQGLAELLVSAGALIAAATMWSRRLAGACGEASSAG